MSNFFKFFVCSFIIYFYSAHANLDPLIKKEYMLNDLEFIRNTFSIGYAPSEWKKKFSEWDLDQEIEVIKNKIESNPKITTKEYQSLLKDFFMSAKDYHVGITFFSTEYAQLPFRIKGAQGRYFISFIDRTRLSQESFPLQIGDELIYFAGRPIEEVISEIHEKEIGNASFNTDRAQAEIHLTSRNGYSGHAVPKGPVMITIRPKYAKALYSYQLIWDYHPEKIANAFSCLAAKSVVKQGEKETKLFLKPNFQKPKLNEEGNDSIGARESYIPELGKICWKSDPSSRFHAYLYENHEGKSIGYLRIAHYMGDQSDVEEFRQHIQFFEEHAEALVIDQINNPGGSMFYMYALLSMLTDQPLLTPKHRMCITQKEVFTAIQEIPLLEAVSNDEDIQALFDSKTLEGIPITYQMAKFILNYNRFIVDEWNAGRILTQPFYVHGVDRVNPYVQTHFTKPILIIVNELDFSGGDFFPAILQDNKRGVIFGTRTAGAGGYVTRTKFSNLSGISSFHYTGSIAERCDSSPIENLGVTPDINYELTPEDLQHGYQGYVEAIQKAVNQLID